MISRMNLKCLICDNSYTVRVQIGFESKQSMVFSCPHCNQDNSFILNLENPPSIIPFGYDNCTPSNQEGPIINLSSSFGIQEKFKNSDLYFPSIDLMRDIIKENSEKIISTQLNIKDIVSDRLKIKVSFANRKEKWKIVEKIIKFYNTNQSDLLQKYLNHYWQTEKKEHDVKNTIFHFLNSNLMPFLENIFSDLMSVLIKAKEINIIEYKRFVEFYNQNLKKDRFENYVSIFSDYFKSYDEFSQMLVYKNFSIPTPMNIIASSCDFRSTKMFYGNAFEVLGSHLSLPAILNNILSNRKFDQMEKMDLKQYMGINKANRTKCFSNNTELSWFVTEYDSLIRNASHHISFKISLSKKEISYRSGGTGAEHKMSYSEYLARCNQLVFQLMMMANLELMILYLEGYEL